MFRTPHVGLYIGIALIGYHSSLLCMGPRLMSHCVPKIMSVPWMVSKICGQKNSMEKTWPWMVSKTCGQTWEYSHCQQWRKRHWLDEVGSQGTLQHRFAQKLWVLPSSIRMVLLCG